MLTPELMKVLLNLGFPGVVIAILCWVCIRLDKRNTDMVTARIAEAKESLTAFNKSTEAVNANTKAIEGLTEIVRMMVK